MIAADDDPLVLTPPRRQFAFDAAVTGLAFLDGDIVAAGFGDGAVRFFASDNEPASAQAHRDGAVLALDVDLDRRSVLTGGDDGRLVQTTPTRDVTCLAEFRGQHIDVIAVSATAGLRAVAAGRQVALLDRDGKPLAATSDHPSTVTGLAFNPKGKRLAVSHYGGVTLWWTARLGQSPARLKWRGSHIGVTWSPDGSTVLTTMQECELHGWRLTDGEHMRMAGYATKVRAMDWLAKPLTLATSGADSVIAWSFTGAGPMGKPPVEIGRDIGRLVTSVAVNPVRPLVAAGFDDGQVALCGLVPPQGVVRLRAGDGGRISGLAWSRDGTQVAAGSDAGMVSHFDIAKAAPVTPSGRRCGRSP
jgi:WD40 repeat protein